MKSTGQCEHRCLHEAQYAIGDGIKTAADRGHVVCRLGDLNKQWMCDVDPSHTPIGASLVRRYGASREVTFRRLSHRRDRLTNVAGLGGLTWADMASIMRDCAEADALTEFERDAASRTARWLGSIGIHPAD